MNRGTWIILAIVGFLLIILIANHDSASILGISTDSFGHAAILLIWAGVLSSAFLSRGTRWADTVKQLAIWFLIIIGLMAGYVFRYDLQDVASRFTGGILPGSPISTANIGGNEVTLIRSDNGHFEAVAGVNGKSVRFLIDTGASAIVLSAKDADLVGIDLSKLAFVIPTQTANGTGRAARATINKIYLGGIERRSLKVLVAPSGRLRQSLLGQQFLESLSSYEKRGDRLTLRD